MVLFIFTESRNSFYKVHRKRWKKYEFKINDLYTWGVHVLKTLLNYGIYLEKRFLIDK